MNREKFIEHALRNDLRWVPTGHSLPRVLNLYLKFLNSGGNDFKVWLTNYEWRPGRRFSKHTAIDYCYPLSENEFDLWAYTEKDIEVLVAGGPGSLIFWRQRRRTNEARLVCLNDARLVGIINSFSLDANYRKAILLEAGYAGAENAAQVIIDVGLTVGKHFGLLDNQGLATEFFEKIFGLIEDGRALDTYL